MNFKFLTTEMDKLLSSCFLTWPIYLSSESAQKLTSRCGLQNSLLSAFRGIAAQFRGTLIGYFPIPPQNEGGIHIIIQKMIVPSLLIWMSFIYKRRQKSPLNLQRVSRYWIQYPPPLCIIVIIIDKRLAVPRLIPGILFSEDESFSA